MNLKELESRREFLGLTIRTITYGTLLYACSSNEEEFLYDPITPDNLNLVENSIKGQLPRFPVISFKQAFTETPNTVINTPKFQEIQEKYRIAGVAIGAIHPQNNLTTMLYFTEDISIGSFFAPSKNKTTLPPVFMFLEDESKILEVTSRHEWKGSSESSVRALFSEFNVNPESLINRKFVLQLNSRLLRIDGRDMPALTIPFRFVIQPAEKGNVEKGNAKHLSSSISFISA
ncbi:hypothetical protein HYU92_03365 [Candidatus Curtissbacteria bacterium]|nr:hypothetical protein [Candidatus Curtissbacteria bacterium]